MKAHKLMIKACSLVLIGSILLSATASTLAHGEDESIHDFLGVTYSKQALEDENVMVIPFSEINQITEEAKGWIDAGTMLYISAPEASNEELAEMLSIPKDDVHVYSPMVILATAVYRYEDIYVFENHYAIFETKEKMGNSIDQDVPVNNTDFLATVTTVDQQNQSGELGFLVDADLAIGTAIESRRKMSECSSQSCYHLGSIMNTAHRG